MKSRMAKWIVRYRTIILVVVLLIAVWSVFQFGRTNINYDLTRYLADDTMTKKALVVMNEEFGSSEQLRLLFENEEPASFDNALVQLSLIPKQI